VSKPHHYTEGVKVNQEMLI